MANSFLVRAPYQVVCVCGGYGYPIGTASAARITVVGKALQTAGIGFRLLHCGSSPVAINTESSGIYEGIPFQYTTPVRWPENSLARLLLYLWGVIGLTVGLARLWPVRFATLVYLYVMDGPLNLYVGCLCWLLGVPVVQELCEWLPGDPTCSAFTRWLHRGSMFRKATGVLVISKAIEERVRDRAARMNLDLLVHRVPAMVDSSRFASAGASPRRTEEVVPQFLYCGTWPEDMYFVIRALGIVKRRGFQCKLRIVGERANAVGERAKLLACALENGLSAEDIIFAGCITENPLAESYKAAIALLMPLPKHDRSITRLPNKLGEYLASGRPVISSRIGDVMTLLTDGSNAYLAKPGNEQDFASKMMAVLQDPVRGDRIGRAGQQVCFAHLDYQVHVRGLDHFFAACIEHHRVSRKRKTQPSRCYTLLRNYFCGLVALGVIVSGRARQARERALRGDVVTAIYFHNPNRRLFDRCIRWLTKHGYVFISAHDLLAILYGQKTSPKGAVWLSFDDGFKQLLERVLPLVRQHKLPITLFIPSGIIEGDGRFPWLQGKTVARSPGVDAPAFNVYRDSITVADLKRIASYPEVTIGSHTVSHAVTINFTPEKARFEFGDSKRKLEAWARGTVECFAYPEGKFDGREGAILAQFGFRLAATTEVALITRETTPYFVPRFCVSDEISFPEAICNMVGVWRPAIDPVIKLWGKWAGRRRSAPASADALARDPDRKEPTGSQDVFASHDAYYEKERNNA